MPGSCTEPANGEKRPVETALDCIPCLVRQTLESARLVSDDASFHEEILRETMRHIVGLSFDQSPPKIATEIHAEIRRRLNNPDPYRAVKQRFNDLALALRPALEAEVAAAADPFERAVHFAIAGNVIDFGVTADIDETHLHEAIEQVAKQPLFGDLEELRRRVAAARHILYLADNTGEIVLDRLLIQQLPRDRVTVAVRGAPIINDATVEDAEQAGITELVPVISNGAAAPGTVLELSSPEFRETFAAADLVIAKGQGNFETLESLSDPPIAFLFRVKCPVVARLSRHPIGSHVVVLNTNSR